MEPGFARVGGPFRRPCPAEVADLRERLNQYVADHQDSEYLRELRNSNLADKIRNDQVDFRWGKAEVVFDQPEKLLHDFSKTEYHLTPMLKPYLDGIKKELIIFSPYFVPGKPGTAFLTGLARRGVRVRILTNSLASNDVGIVHAGYKKYRRPLLRGGVELYELMKTSSGLRFAWNSRKTRRGWNCYTGTVGKTANRWFTPMSRTPASGAGLASTL